MDLKAQNNQTRAQAAPAPVAAPAPRAVAPEQRKSPVVKIVVGLVIVLVVAAAGIYVAKTLGGSGASATVAVDRSKFQAVFLTNGQVYFGKIDSLDGKYVKLSNIYYLQVQQDVQPAKSNEKSESGVSLTKLGSELHGPDDEMHISSDQILFWENLKGDSRVVKTITEFENKK